MTLPGLAHNEGLAFPALNGSWNSGMSLLTPDPKAMELYGALTSSAGLIFLDQRTQLEINGADRTGFLNGFCTGDMKKLQPGSGCEVFITNHQGKAAGHGWVFCEADRLLFDGPPGQAEKLIAHLDRFVISERVEFRDHSADWSDLLLAGPKAEDVLRQLGVESPTDRLQHRPVNIARCPVSLRRVDLLSPIPSFLLGLPREETPALIAAFLNQGTQFNAGHASTTALEMARLEAGYPFYGHDITEDNLPQEVNRNEQAISFTKGCYLGQETIARLDALGHVNRILTGLKFPEGANPQPGETIMQGEKKIAQITSVAYSPKLQSPLALAYVRSIHATPGKRIPYAGGEVEVVKLPL